MYKAETIFGTAKWLINQAKTPRGGGGRGGGVLEVYMTGVGGGGGRGPTYVFGLKIYTLGILFGSRDLSRIFLGLKNIRVFFWVLSPSELFVSGFRCNQCRKIFIRTFFQRRVFLYICNIVFGLEILMPGIFLGLKFRACVFFWVCNMKLRRTPPPAAMYTSSTPPPAPPPPPPLDQNITSPWHKQT